MKTIPLTQGQHAIVDDADYERLSAYRWYAAWKNNTYYAARKTPLNGRKQGTEYMHHVIIGKPQNGQVTDHRNRNGLDNRRSNLRHATKSVNRMNTDATGVSWDKERGKWRAQMMVNGKQYLLGRFTNYTAACRARRKAIMEAMQS